MKDKFLPTEHEEQVRLMVWAESHKHQYPELGLIYAVPNMGNRHINFAKKMRAEGLKSGVPDLVLPVARQNFHGLYIEMKRLKNGATSKDQKEWLSRLRDEGYAACVCKGWEDAVSVITNYLGV